MKRRWIVPAGRDGNIEIAIERDGGLMLHVIGRRCRVSEYVGVILSENDRLDLIEALKAAGRSRAGIQRDKSQEERSAEVPRTSDEQP